MSSRSVVSVGPFEMAKDEQHRSRHWERATIKPSSSSSGRYVEDSVEVSGRGRRDRESVRAGPVPRNDLIARIRAEIGAGTYVTEEKVGVAVDRLIACEFTEFYY